jgi:type II restriction enzyme
MNNVVESAIQACTAGSIAFTKFITANDTGATGGHQSGFHFPKNSWPLFFDKPGIKGENKDIFITIKWQGDFETPSRFTYYGIATRNEYRLTRFGRAFPFLKEDNIGDLLVISKIDRDYYEGWVLSSDIDIDEFFVSIGIASTDTNKILPKSFQSPEENFAFLFRDFILSLKADFPPTIELAKGARAIHNQVYGTEFKIISKQPDNELLKWISTEFELFKAIENDRYRKLIGNPFKSVDDLIKTANTILNRRKSRAGKSLEHHLSEIFNIRKIEYSSQPVTEGNKKPDFIFPNIETYYSEPFSSKKLSFLGVKTTCKDRWRQIIGEADKIPQKHLFTLQQGISGNQLKEMEASGVSLVVPKPYLDSFPKPYRDKIWTLSHFINYVESKQK